MNSIILIGFMGTGKSAVGQTLARQLGWTCYDTDQMIAEQFGFPVREVFARFGEACFREAEAKALAELNPKESAIIVTGGGIVLQTRNVERLRELGRIVCLTTNISILVKRLAAGEERPLLKNRATTEGITELMRQRETLYAAAADLSFDTSDKTPKEVAELIIDELCRRS